MRESAAPFGQPLLLNSYSLDATITCGVTDRVSVTMTVPFSRGIRSRFYSNGSRETVEAAGLGDISGIANIWVRRPSTAAPGDIAIGFGLKTVSGNNDVIDNFFLDDGSVTKNPVDQ